MLQRYKLARGKAKYILTLHKIYFSQRNLYMRPCMGLAQQ